MSTIKNKEFDGVWPKNPEVPEIMRRCKRVNIPESMLVEVLNGICTIVDLPEGSFFSAVHVDYSFGGICARLHHESFDVVELGNQIPFHEGFTFVYREQEYSGGKDD